MTDRGRDLLPRPLDDAVERAIDGSRARFEELVGRVRNDAGHPLAIKYMPTRFGALYAGPKSTLRISDRPGFTWGTGVYATPLHYPISSGIYGRAGVVSWFDPAGWRVFDCTDRAVEELYLQWLQYQPELREVLVTVHSGHLNQVLRNQFRRLFGIDCVLFHPDEFDGTGLYTKQADVWMAVGEFGTGGILATGTSSRFHDARLVVVLEEEFEVDSTPKTKSALLKLTATRESNAILTADIVQRYRAAAGYTRVSS